MFILICMFHICYVYFVFRPINPFHIQLICNTNIHVFPFISQTTYLDRLSRIHKIPSISQTTSLDSVMFIHITPSIPLKLPLTHLIYGFWFILRPPSYIMSYNAEWKAWALETCSSQRVRRHIWLNKGLCLNWRSNLWGRLWIFRWEDQSTRCDCEISSCEKAHVGFIICLAFIAAEITGGIISNSLAILTDATHLLLYRVKI